MLADSGLLLSGSVYLGPVVSSGFFTLCRENFTSPADYEATLMKAGHSETRKGLAQKKQYESLGWAALAHWEVREKAALGTGSEE